jgi:hypothetical protein
VIGLTADSKLVDNITRGILTFPGVNILMVDVLLTFLNIMAPTQAGMQL